MWHAGDRVSSMVIENNGRIAKDFRTIRVTLAEEMDAYDRLPKAIRKWLQDAPVRLSAVNIRRSQDEVWRNHPP